MSAGLIFLICFLVILVLEPKIVGALFYWAFLAAVGFVGFIALLAWLA